MTWFATWTENLIGNYKYVFFKFGESRELKVFALVSLFCP